MFMAWYDVLGPLLKEKFLKDFHYRSADPCSMNFYPYSFHFYGLSLAAWVLHYVVHLDICVQYAQSVCMYVCIYVVKHSELG